MASVVFGAAGASAAPTQPADTTFSWDQPVVTVNSKVADSWGVAKAVEQWNARRVSGQPLLVIRNGSTDPDILIHAVRAAHWWTGLTTGTADESGTITHITISLNLSTIGKAKYIYDGTSVAAREWTTSHELGHALGLEHSQSITRSVMSYANPWWRTDGLPSGYDFRQLALLY